MLRRTAKSILLLYFLFNAVVAAYSLSPDLRLIQMVPPGSQVIASMLSPKPDVQLRSFLLITVNNSIDIEDFYAVTGADASRRIHQVVFVAASGGDGTLSEHSLLVSGHFNRDAIFRFAESGNARTESYRGEAVLIVPPLARERTTFKQLRWLAILNSDIAIFGTQESVQQELDRQIANSQPDPNLLERLSRLGRGDETWCMLLVPSAGRVVGSVLEKLDAKIAAVAREGASMQYGVHLGRRVEITVSSNITSRESSDPETDESAAHSTPAQNLLDASSAGGDDGRIAVVKVSRRRYEEWLEKFPKGNLTIAWTLPH
jgi:hypothetical protein